MSRPESGLLGLPPPPAATGGPGPTTPERARGARADRAASRDEPGPQGSEAVGGRGLPSPGGHRSALRLALLTPGGGSRDPGEEDGKEERKAAATAKNTQAHRQLRQTTDKRETSRRALPLSAHVTSGRPGAGPRLAPPRDRFAPPMGG